MKLIILLLLISFYPLNATPQLALHTRNKCINCHLNDNGSGVRNEYGWATVRDFSLIDSNSLGSKGTFGFLYSSNTILDETLYIGADIRAQMAQSLKPNSTNRFFVKQIALHSAYEASDWLNLEGSYNFADIVYQNHGQQSWTASMVLDIIPDFPRIRAGKFQPSIGVRYDDHTMLIRNLANANIYANPILSIDYAEYGVDVIHTIQDLGPYYVFTLSAGLFDAENLSKVTFPATGGEVPIVDGNTPSLVLRAVMNENTGFSDYSASYAGLSYFKNADLFFINPFAGIGLFKILSIFSEYMYGVKTDLLRVENLILATNIHLCKPLFIELRLERAKSYYQSIDITDITKQFVAGIHFFPFPYVELKGEYRIMQTEEIPQEFSQYKGALYFFQLHCFY
jgi:hypothetical protein